MSWIRSLVARLSERHSREPAPPSSPLRENDQGNDTFAELIAASSLLDFGGTIPEPRLKHSDLERGLRPW
jgi:hypothetical protein